MDKITLDVSERLSRQRKFGAAQCWARARRLVLGLSLAFACQSALAQAIYRITDLGTLGGSTSSGAALNAKGQATGFADTSGDASSHAFLWQSTAKGMQDLGALDGYGSQGVAINNSGQVTGNSNVNFNDTHAFVWKNNGTPMQDLGTLGGSYSYAVAINTLGQVAGFSGTKDINSGSQAFIWKNDGTPLQNLGNLGGTGAVANDMNDAGQVTGYADDVNGAFRAFIWKNNGTPMQDLGDLGGVGNTYGYAIDKSGQVTGISRTAKNIYHAFLWRNDGTPMQDLGDLAGSGSTAVAINDSGQVAGYSCTQKKCFFNRAFLWKNDGTPMVDLGTLGGYESGSNALNSTGQVTGWSTVVGKTVEHAFVWRNDGTKLQDVNALIDTTDPLKPYVVLTDGIDINDAGQVLADGTDSRTGLPHAYLLTGTILTVSPRALAYGNQPIQTTSAAKSVTVTNTSPKAAPVTSIALTGTAAGQFAQTNNCGKSLAGHAICTIKVTFKPTTKGAKSESLNVNGGGGGLRTVSLTGTGT